MKNGRFKKDSAQASRDKNKISKINTLVGYNNKSDTIEEKSSEHNDIGKENLSTLKHSKKRLEKQSNAE